MFILWRHFVKTQRFDDHIIFYIKYCTFIFFYNVSVHVCFVYINIYLMWTVWNVSRYPGNVVLLCSPISDFGTIQGNNIFCRDSRKDCRILLNIQTPTDPTIILRAPKTCCVPPFFFLFPLFVINRFKKIRWTRRIFFGPSPGWTTRGFSSFGDLLSIVEFHFFAESCRTKVIRLN